MGKSVLREIRLDLRTGDGKHGPDEPLTPRRNAAESGKTGAAREIQEHGFQIVVLRVRRCDEAVQGREERVAKRARCFLNGFVRLCRAGAYITVINMEHDVQLGAERTDKRLVAV